MGKVVVDIKKLSKRYDQTTVALNSMNLKIYSGEWTVIMGPSGSGKTTLLNIISCLDRPTSGRIKVMGMDLTKLNNKQLTLFRRNSLGMIFQQYHLIPYLTASQNVQVAQYFHGQVDKAGTVQALHDVGLEHRSGHIPAKLSGGEQQRVAIARALINEPDIILADEPTGNLDSSTGDKIMNIFRKLHDKGQTIIFVTHDERLAAWGDRIVRLVDGKVVSDVRNKQGG